MNAFEKSCLMTVLFCIVKSVGTYCIGNPGGYGGGPLAWYLVSLATGAALVVSSIVKPWGKYIDNSEHSFVFIEAIKLAALFFLVVSPEQLSGYQCFSPASLGQVVGPICTPGANVAANSLQCDPNWYAGAGFNLTTTQLADLASVCGVPDFLPGYFAILGVEIFSMAYFFIVQKCVLPAKTVRFSLLVITGHLVLIGINCIMWGIYELFIHVTYSGGVCRLPMAGSGIVLRAFCSLYMFIFSLILVVLIHRLRNRGMGEMQDVSLAKVDSRSVGHGNVSQMAARKTLANVDVDE